MKGPGKAFLQILLISVSLLELILVGCTSSRASPDLDSKLYELYLAQKRGEAEAFAKQAHIDLRDRRVLVIIESEPGQSEAAARAATLAGARVLNVVPEWDMMDALVPVSKLPSLAESKSIKLIRQPMRPSPGLSN